MSWNGAKLTWFGPVSDITATGTETGSPAPSASQKKDTAPITATAHVVVTPEDICPSLTCPWPGCECKIICPQDEEEPVQ